MIYFLALHIFISVLYCVVLYLTEKTKYFQRTHKLLKKYLLISISFCYFAITTALFHELIVSYIEDHQDLKSEMLIYDLIVLMSMMVIFVLLNSNIRTKNSKE